MRLKIFLISLMTCFSIHDSTSMDTPQSLAQQQEGILIHVAKILGNAIENQLNERHRSIRAVNEATKQYVEEQFDYLNMMLQRDYKIQNSEEKLLKKILECTNGTIKMWPFVAKYYANKGYDTDFLIRLFETKAGIDTSKKFDILSHIIYKGGPRDRLTPYIVGLIRKGELHPKEICLAMVFLQYSLLNESDWLAIIDGVFPEHRSFDKLKGDKSDLEFKDFLLKHIESTKLGLKLYQDMERFKRQSVPSAGHLNTLGILKDLDVMLYHPAACEEMRYVLKRTKRPFLTDMSLVQHLSHRFKKEINIRDFIMDRWVTCVDHRSTILSMDQLGILANQAHNISNHDLAQKLFLRANRVVKPINAITQPFITFVAGDESRGDGHTLDSLDGFMGTQYDQVKLIARELVGRGFEYKVISWKDPNIAWEKELFLVLQTPWGYSKEQVDFMEWLERIKHAKVPLINPLDFINWTIKNTYLKDLQEESIPVIPTMIVDEKSDLTFQQVLGHAKEKFGTTDIILKGVIGAGGFDYFHYKPGLEEEAEAHLERLKRENSGSVIQPFCQEFSRKGELSIVIAGGTPLYLFWKICAPNGELVQVFYGGCSFHLSKDDLSSNWDEFYAKIKEFNPGIDMTQTEMQLACGQIHKLILDLRTFYSKHNISEPPLYRLDVVVKSTGDKIDLMIGEIEGIDPYLELGKTKHQDLVVRWYVDELIRQYSIIMGRK